jgi:lipoteichoic acid synthase
MLVIYGDHNAFLKDSAEFASLAAFRLKDPFGSWTTRHKVPLIIRLPKREAAGIRTTFGGRLDVAPTILSLLGVRDDVAVMM